MPHLNLWTLQCFLTLLIGSSAVALAEPLRFGGMPGELAIREAGSHSLRLTVRPLTMLEEVPPTPALVESQLTRPAFRLRELEKPMRQIVGAFQVGVSPRPFTVSVSDLKGREFQRFVFADDGTVSFRVNDAPVFGLGGGGPRPAAGVDWRKLPVEYDRRGRMHELLPRWQSDAYGSRSPAAVLIEPAGWALFVASPWVVVDLRNPQRGVFLPWKPTPEDSAPQTTQNQRSQRSKGRPPAATQVLGLFDVFVFDAAEPAQFFRDFSVITGPAALPPKWALGYMQSHRTLEDTTQMLGIVDEFRRRRIPLDAVIYLGTGFTPRGWNRPQPSFEFNPEVFKQPPARFISALHARNVRVVLHVVPWNRDRLPTLHGTIPPRAGETAGPGHIQTYWKDHEPLVKLGVDAFWPDEGDWFNLHERIRRTQMYYQGQLSTQPERRPWSLLRNGYPGMARWGAWIWSGDTDSSWKTLEAQIAVALNFGVSIGPFWGSDIGGFFPNEELTGELYARWFQFGAFCPSFRSHGRTWQTRLPWGWGLTNMGPLETKTPPLQSEMSNPAVEPVVKSFVELRYRLLPYTYTLAWEARNTGLPMMRPLWVHHPADKNCQKSGSQFLWGRDLLIAPVVEKGATNRDVYLPAGYWYDWWTGASETGGHTVHRAVDLATMPIYVRAGAILPLDPLRQYSSEKVSEPTTLRIYRGADGRFTLYDDDGVSQAYLKGEATAVDLAWDNAARRLTLHTASAPGLTHPKTPRAFRIELFPENQTRDVVFSGGPVVIAFSVSYRGR